MYKYPYQYKNQHDADAIAIFCMDFRYKDSIWNYLKEGLGISAFDVIGIAGSSKPLADPDDPAHSKTLLKQIELSHKLHNIKKVILIDHSDCGAYGGKKAFKDDAEEHKHHEEKLDKAEEIIKQAFPGLEVKKVYANLKEDNVEFEEF